MYTVVYANYTSVKLEKKQVLARMWREGNTCAVLMGMQIAIKQYGGSLQS